MTRPEDEQEDEESLPPGGKAMQRRRQFLEQRGLRTEEESADEPGEGDSTLENENEEDTGQTAGADESLADEATEGNEEKT